VTEPSGYYLDAAAMTSPFWIVSMAVAKTLRHAVWLFLIVIIDLVAAGYGGVPALQEQIEKFPKGVAKVRSGVRWAVHHPLAFVLDLAGAAALGIFLWQSFNSVPQAAPAWLNAIFALGPALCALALWPAILGRVLRYRGWTFWYGALLAVASFCLYRLTLPAPLEIAFWIVVAIPAMIFGAPVVLGVLLAIWSIFLPVMVVLFLGAGLLFRWLIGAIGLEGIARVLEGLGLVALGLAAYYTYSDPAQFGLTPHEVYGLAYAGALCGALSVGFTGLSFLSERVRGWLGDKKPEGTARREAPV
jgi:hypothetical protein